MTDAKRFEAFVSEYQDLVFATAVRLLGNPADAEDVAQTVFLRAFERFADVQSHPGRAGWLRTVTTNLCLTHLSRYRGRWQFFSEIDGTRPTGSTPFAETLQAPEPLRSGDLDDDRVGRLEAALRRLPDHQRVPLALFHFEERGYQDIADLLGVSLGKVKTDIHRGRETLRRVLGGEDRAAHRRLG